MINYTLNAKRYLYISISAITVLALFSVAAVFLHTEFENDLFRFILRRLYHEYEFSVPTVANFILISLNWVFAFMAYISNHHRDFRLKYSWLVLAIIFFLIGYDELAQIHETLTEPMRQIFGSSPLLYYAWTPIGLAIAVFCSFIFLPFLMRLDCAISSQLVFSGGIYLLGSLGVESLGGAYVVANGVTTQYYFITIVEESLEMLGMALAGYAILSYLSRTNVQITVSVVQNHTAQ